MAEDMFRRKKVKRLFQVLSSNYQVKQSLREAYDRIAFRTEKKVEAESYSQWRRLFLNERMVKD